jgi:chorismate synthase
LIEECKREGEYATSGIFEVVVLGVAAGVGFPYPMGIGKLDGRMARALDVASRP